MNWNKTQLLAILPQRMRQEHYEDVTEVRLRLGRPPRLMTCGGFRDLPGAVEEGELRYVLNAASGYSPWNAASMADGYLTAPGGIPSATPHMSRAIRMHTDVTVLIPSPAASPHTPIRLPPGAVR